MTRLTQIEIFAIILKETDFYMSESNEQFINELTQTLDFNVNAQYPSRDSGFNIINILSPKFKDEGFPIENESGNNCESILLNSIMTFILVHLNV